MISKHTAIAVQRLIGTQTSYRVDYDDTEQILYENLPEEDQPTQEEIIAMIAVMEAEEALVAYKTERDYGPIPDQLDKLYHDIDTGKFGADAKTGDWFLGCQAVKTAHPKPQ